MTRPLQQFEEFIGVYQPKRVHDLKKGVDAYIGRQFIWRALWIIDSGIYINQWALQPIVYGEQLPFVWAPEEDVERLEPVPATDADERSVDKRLDKIDQRYLNRAASGLPPQGEEETTV